MLFRSPKGTDIHKNGIQPDVVAVMPEKEIRTFKVEDLGTNRDSQYRVAETTLIKALAAPAQGRAYQPGSANLQSALQR